MYPSFQKMAKIYRKILQYFKYYTHKADDLRAQKIKNLQSSQK